MSEIDLEGIIKLDKVLIEKDKEIERLNNIIKELKTLKNEDAIIIEKLGERIDKATEYVKSKKAIINTDYIRIFDLFKIEEQGYTDELLNILQGSDKE